MGKTWKLAFAFLARASLTAFVTALACVCAPRRALAQSAGIVEYTEDTGCPDRAAFLARVWARTDRLVVVESGATAPTFRVRAESLAGHAQGELQIVDPSGAVSARDVDGSTCEEVVDALALIVALAVDPDVASRLPSPAPARPPSHPIENPPKPPEAADEWRWRRTAGAGVDVSAGVAPVVLVGPILAVEAELVPISRGACIDPVVDVRLSFVRTASRTVSAAVGSAEFTWTVGRLDGCPLRMALSRVELFPCFRVEAGVLDVSGHGVDVPGHAPSAWSSLGAVARLRWNPFGPWLVEIDGSVSVAITQDRFFFDRPPTTIYHVPAWLGGASASAGVRFW